MRKAHRVSWEIAKGKPPPEGSDLLHACDTPPCINPDHVSPGSNQDNVDDKIAKGRQIHGEQMGSAKLTADQVAKMRAMRAAGRPVEEIGAAFGISGAHAARVCLGRTWKHLGAMVAPKRPGRLTEQQVAAIRAQHASGASRATLAAEFGISKAHVTRVALGKYW
jgi:hypothetical protein